MFAMYFIFCYCIVKTYLCILYSEVEEYMATFLNRSVNGDQLAQLDCFGLSKYFRNTLRTSLIAY